MAWLLPLAWLLPNHHFPWASAWQDGLALVAVAFMALLLRGPMHLPWVWGVFGGVIASTLCLQVLTGVLAFTGDAWMVLLYIGAFLLALAVGFALLTVVDSPEGDKGVRGHLVSAFCLALAAGALISGFIALLQWVQKPLLGVWMIALPPGGRPFGNFGQPNNLSSAAVLGLGALLWLHQVRRLPAVAVGLLGTCMIIIVVMTGSRAGLLQLVVTLCAAIVLRNRLALRLRRLDAAALLLVAGVLALLWPSINAGMAFENARSIQQLASESVRIPTWQLLLQAAFDSPWLGHGWLQIAKAQWSVALEAPPIHRLFEHSHNLVVDLFVWVGVPAGSLLFLLVLFGVLGPDPGRINAESFWLRAMVGALLVHQMVEFPLSHAYFLMPAGLLLGLAYALEGESNRPSVRAANRPQRFGMALSGLVLAASTGLTAFDYIRAEIDHRALRMESTRIAGAMTAVPAEPLKLLVLDQLEAFLTFARSEARVGMSAEELASFSRVALRYPIPPALLRLALAQGLNGRPEAAADTLARLCRMHDPLRCDEGRQSWAAVQALHPALRAVPYPVTSPPPR